MNYWITTDTHLGHDAMIQYCGRPEDHSELILRRHRAAIKPTDILIHLGDICIYRDEYWHKQIMDSIPGKKWLVKGNHDRKSDHWYLTHGWDFVAEKIYLRRFGALIALSHIPIKDDGYDINIHGHFHNSDHRRHEPELVAIRNDKQRLVMVEHSYAPIDLQRICDLTTEHLTNKEAE